MTALCSLPLGYLEIIFLIDLKLSFDQENFSPDLEKLLDKPG